jgi:hypothetical protein
MTKEQIFILVISMILLILRFLKLSDKIFIYNIITIFGTFCHELMHYIVALFLNGQPLNINFYPRKKEKFYELGSVTCNNLTWYNAFFISFAPLILLFIVFFIYNNYVFNSTINNLIILAIISGILIEGSIPSIVDIKQSLKSIPFMIILFILYNLGDIL